MINFLDKHEGSLPYRLPRHICWLRPTVHHGHLFYRASGVQPHNLEGSMAHCLESKARCHREAYQAAVSSRRCLRTKPYSFRGDNSSSDCRFRRSLSSEPTSRARGATVRGTCTFLCPLLGAASKLLVLLGARHLSFSPQCH